MQESSSTLEKDETFSILVNIGAIEEALIAIDKCGCLLYCYCYIHVIGTF